MKKTFIFFLIFIFLSWSIYSLKADETTCKYEGEVNQCLQTKNPRSIEDFICDWTNDEEKTYQVILDLKFQEIDKEIVLFLDSLQKWKDYYFWPEKKETYIDWINYVNETFWKYWILWKRYKKFCDPSDTESVVNNYLSCSKTTSSVVAAQYFTETECMTLVEYKLDTYKKIAYNVLWTNKLQVLKDYRKKQFQTTRTMYDNLIDSMNINLDDITKINSQWNYKTEQCK